MSTGPSDPPLPANILAPEPHALHAAILRRDPIRIIRAILDTDDFDINATNSHKQSALHLAAISLQVWRDSEDFEPHGIADGDDEDGYSADEGDDKRIKFVLRLWPTRVIRQLLKHRQLKLDIEDENGCTPIDLVAQVQSPRRRYQVTMDMLAAKAFFRTPPAEVNNYLHFAIGEWSAGSRDRALVVSKLLESGACVYSRAERTIDTRTALEKVQQECKDPRVLKLLEAAEIKILERCGLDLTDNAS
jgi:ankyrin repeat protein